MAIGNFQSEVSDRIGTDWIGTDWIGTDWIGSDWMSDWISDRYVGLMPSPTPNSGFDVCAVKSYFGYFATNLSAFVQ